MKIDTLLEKFQAVAANPRKQLDDYLAAGEKVVAVGPVYPPEEVIHAMGLVPMGVWGADVTLDKAKEYFPAFICSIVQSVVELGMSGAYDGVSALVVPLLCCDALNTLGENWKYAVPNIPYIPMVYPQNRFDDNGRAFALANYQRVARDLEKITGNKLTDENLSKSIAIYNEHSQTMRELASVLPDHPEITTTQRAAIYKSAWFMRKEEHTALVKEFIAELKQQAAGNTKIKIMTAGALCDSPSLLAEFDKLGMQIVCDDIAAETRQYRIDCAETGEPLKALTERFSKMGNCSVLYDVNKGRADYIVEQAKKYGAKGVVYVLTKFCDPEEFDYVIVKKACDKAGLPLLQIEVDRQMQELGQASTALETFCDLLR